MRLRFEGPAGGVGRSVGGGVGGGCLDRLVGHDPSGKLLLGFLEAGSRGAVESVHLDRAERDDGQSAEPPSLLWQHQSPPSNLCSVGQLHLSAGTPKQTVQTRWASLAPTYLFEHDEGAHGQSGEQGCDQQHDDAHRDAGVEADESQDPATGGGGNNRKPHSHGESVSTHSGTCKDGAGKIGINESHHVPQPVMPMVCRT